MCDSDHDHKAEHEQRKIESYKYRPITVAMLREYAIDKLMVDYLMAGIRISRAQAKRIMKAQNEPTLAP